MMTQALKWYHSLFIVRLRGMLLYEEEQYIVELESKEETTEDRQSRMKARAKELKGRRENERQEYVALKLEQQFQYVTRFLYISTTVEWMIFIKIVMPSRVISIDQKGDCLVGVCCVNDFHVQMGELNTPGSPTQDSHW